MNPLEGKCSFWLASMCMTHSARGRWIPAWIGFQISNTTWAGGGHSGTQLGLLSDRCFDRTPLLLLLRVVPMKCFPANPQRGKKKDREKLPLSLLSFLLLINSYLCLRYMLDKSESFPGVPRGFDRLLLFNNAWWCILIQCQATAMDDAHAVLLVGKSPCRMKVAMYFLHADIKGLICSS